MMPGKRFYKNFNVARAREAYERRRNGEAFKVIAADMGISQARVDQLVRKYELYTRRPADTE